jgi:hypothetical protein
MIASFLEEIYNRPALIVAKHCLAWLATDGMDQWKNGGNRFIHKTVLKVPPSLFIVGWE